MNSMIYNIFIFIIHALLGYVVSFVRSFIGGQCGINFRDYLNSTKKYPIRRNNWGDTEGTYLLYYSFYLAAGSAVALPLLTNVITSNSTWLTFLIFCSLTSLTTASICGY